MSAATPPLPETPVSRPRLHYAWVVLAVTFAVLLLSAGVRSLSSLFLLPLEAEFGWNRGHISAVISLGILLYGLSGPFSASLLLRFGIRRVVGASLGMLGLSLALAPFITALWQYVLLWGVLSGAASGMLASVLGVTIANRWFVKRRGLVVGLLTASAAAGQLLFLPLMAQATDTFGWRSAVWIALGALAAVLLLVLLLLKDHPAQAGLPAYGADRVEAPEPFRGRILLEPLLALRDASRTPVFWLLAGTFFFCGFSTNGLIGTHLIAACGDAGMLAVTAAGLLALMGLFDLVGTTLSGWLTDRFDSRKLLFWYYGLRGLSLLYLPYALTASPAHLLLFSIFYGLDWIATVPPTVKLTGEAFGKQRAGMIFGWILVSHQLGASAAAYSAGALRSLFGSYTISFAAAGFVCLLAALMALRIRARAVEAAAGPAV
ncbi:MFS transporter [Paenibacillus sp. B01]|uniref:MFS transporter n=1 Tax=Paenibacillus sp. B01 TaxID=2660554 RepID=UPI00129A4C31|nr:MFS transporter [Paenibacillus sp. B01]QGG58282.1 MFS transporter [Paenibacillus sp. B01]